MKLFKPLLLLLAILPVALTAFPQQPAAKKIENVVYGMVAGTALLLDVYLPEKSNHRAIIYIAGSGWGFGYPADYDQVPLKDDLGADTGYTGKWAGMLVKHGYTVVAINHRFSPQYRSRDIIEDCRRAVRFVRYKAKEYGIDPLHIGAMGHSSGGNLASLLGVSDSTYYSNRSPADSFSSKVQAVVTLAAPFNLADVNQYEDSAIANNYVLSAVSAYMGGLPEMVDGNFKLAGRYRDASPIAHVTKDDAPMLIIYSDNDPVIPVRQAKAMHQRLKQQQVPTTLIASPNTQHNPVPDMMAVCKWFDQYLQ